MQLLGNPNVGKSTIFNHLTGLNQHTGNWTGKTVSTASGIVNYKNNKFLLVDIPGTYSIMSNSQEEEIARDYICFGNSNCIIVVLDATCLERNLNLVYQILEITNNIVVCVNLLDEAKKKGIFIDLKKLSSLLGVPVVGTIARKKKTLKSLMDAVYTTCYNSANSKSNSPITYILPIENSISLLEKVISSIFPNIFNTNYRWISLKLLDGNSKIINSIENFLHIDLIKNKIVSQAIVKAKNLLLENNITSSLFKDEIVSEILFKCEEVSDTVTTYNSSNSFKKQIKIDKILTSKFTGIPIMLLFFCFIFWLTIVGSNYPSKILSNLFNNFEYRLIIFFQYMHTPTWLCNLLVCGLYRTLTWIISVMLPPMAIFFPLFTILEDLGFLPRIAFNLDGLLKKASTSRKASLNHVHGIRL